MKYFMFFFRFDYFIGYDEAKGREVKISVYNVKGEKHDEEQLIGEVRNYTDYMKSCCH